jgi:hypothetical protein
MTTNITSLLSRYRQKGILIDTNILLLYFVGYVNRDRISKFKRTAQFVPEDYDLLVRIVQFFQRIVTTPNILTEVNSLMNQLGEPERSRCLMNFSQNIAILEESYLESQSAAAAELFIKLGLTDCGIIQIAKQPCLILTDDFRLANYLQSMNIDVINFNNIRVLGWQ